MTDPSTVAVAPATGSLVRAALADHLAVTRAAARARELAAEAVDRCQAARTVPRGDGPKDTDRAPGVDPEVWLLHVRYHRTRDQQTLDLLVQEYDRYATALAARLHREQESMDDLEQVAREGLVTALQRFDPERGLPFPALATPTILGAIRRHYRDRGWAIRVPRRVHEVAVAARRVEERLTTTLGRAPKVAEIAHELDISVDELLEVQDAVHCRNATSLDVPTGSDADSPSVALGDHDPLLVGVDSRVDLQSALSLLDARDREVVRLYFFEELSQSEIGERFGVSQMQVSRWLSSILRRLRVQVLDR